MARYRYNRGASAGDVMLAVDRSREEFKEIKAYEQYLSDLRKQAKKKKKGGLFGSILGAVVGFALGGPAGAMLGYGVGKGTVAGAIGYENFKKSRKSLGSDVWQGGKFDYTKTKNLAKTSLEEAKTLRDADLTGAVIDIALGATGYASAGGSAATKAWRASDATFGQKLGSAFKPDSSSLKATTQKSADSIMAGKGNVLDLVQRQNTILQPFGTVGRSLATIAKSPFNSSTIGQLMRMNTASEAIKRGDIELGAYLLSGYYDKFGRPKV